jgi:hypothetical protein
MGDAFPSANIRGIEYVASHGSSLLSRVQFALLSHISKFQPPHPTSRSSAQDTSLPSLHHPPANHTLTSLLAL